MMNKTSLVAVVLFAAYHIANLAITSIEDGELSKSTFLCHFLQLIFFVSEDFMEMKAQCGEVCETHLNRTKVVGRMWYNIVKKNFDCPKIFKIDLSGSQAKFSSPPTKVDIC